MKYLSNFKSVALVKGSDVPINRNRCFFGYLIGQKYMKFPIRSFYSMFDDENDIMIVISDQHLDF